MKKLILDIAKIIGALATIGGAVLWFDAKFDDNADSLNEIQETVDYINVEQSLMSEDIQGIHDTLERFEGRQLKQGEDIKSITWILKNQDNFTSEQLREIMDEMLKKQPESVYRGSVEFVPID